MSQLKTLTPDALPSLDRQAVDADTLRIAGEIVDDVRVRGVEALRAHAERLGDLQPGGRLVYDRAALNDALESLPADARAVLERTAARIRTFAEAQRMCLQDLTVDIPGGRAGHRVEAVRRAACYAPGGRFPLPSSVLMTAVTARAAGVESVWVASPKPVQVTLAAAAIAGADALLAVGGAQAIAALAYGCADHVPACDVIVGPGNRWVTAAKKLVVGNVAIDMLAGPSELVILADTSAVPSTLAADLLAQAEHDTDALPILVTDSAELIAATNDALTEQLSTLPTAATASVAVSRGFAVLVSDLEEGIRVCDQLAPEHLQVHVRDAGATAEALRAFGGLFVGVHAAEVLGDYGAGPNHTLPTGGTARFTGGLSVQHFLATRTWLEVNDPVAAAEMTRDAVALARMEGLEAHARAAEVRLEGIDD